MSRFFETRRAAWLIPLLLFVLALIPRLVVLGWGLPYVEHPDEPALMDVVMKMLQQGDPNPGMFLYPSLHFYMLAVVLRLGAAWGVAQGLYPDLASIPNKTYLFTTAPNMYLWGRALTALLGAATIPLLYALGRRMFDWRVALLAALALAFAPYHVEHSHFITTDVPTGLWVALALLGAWQVAQQGSWRGYIIGAVATGLAAGTKYNAGVVGLVLAVAGLIYLLDQRRANPAWRTLLPQQIGRLVMAGALALLVFLLTTPYALLDWPGFRRGMQINATHYASGSHGDFIGRWRLDGYLGFIWDHALLPLGVVLLILGLPFLLRSSWRQVAILGASILVCGGLLLTQAVNFERNVLPLFSPLFLLAAAAVIALADAIRSRIIKAPPWAATIPVFGLALALLIPQLLGTSWLLNYWSKPHTLVAAAEVLRSQPRGMLAAVEMNPVQWAGDPVVTPVDWLGSYAPDWYRAHGYRYLVVNAERYDTPDAAAYQRLFEGTTILADYPIRRLGLQPGPGATIFDLGEQIDQIPFVRREVNFGQQIELLGYEMAVGELRTRITPLEGANVEVASSGQPLQINLYWRGLAKLPIDYTLFMHIYDENNQRVTQRDLPLRYEDYPSSHWQPGELVIDRADLPLPALSPGSYRIELGLYDPASGQALPGPDGAPVVLSTFRIE